MRFLWILTAGWLLAPATQAPAATVAAYSANAFGTVSLVSALAATGEDASALLFPSEYDDDLHADATGDASTSYHQPSGRADAPGRVNANGGAAEGRADAASGPAESYRSSYFTSALTYLDPDYTCRLDPGAPGCLGTLELTFGYVLMAETTASILGMPGDSTAEASAAVSICIATVPCGGEIGIAVASTASAASGSLWDRSEDALDGLFSLFLNPGETAYVDIYVDEVRGSAAAVPAENVLPTPLPPALPLLAAGFGGLALVARRFRRDDGFRGGSS